MSIKEKIIIPKTLPDKHLFCRCECHPKDTPRILPEDCFDLNRSSRRCKKCHIRSVMECRKNRDEKTKKENEELEEEIEKLEDKYEKEFKKLYEHINRLTLTVNELVNNSNKK